MARKSYFMERTATDIRGLNQKDIYHQRGLVRKILDLDPSEDGLTLKTRLTPGRFYRTTDDSSEASRKCYKHGDIISLSVPKTKEKALKSREIPLAVRDRDFSRLAAMKEEEINFIGYSFRPVQGTDRRKRFIPFAWLPEAVRLFSYAENLAGQIDIKSFTDAKRVSKEGATIVCSVPSRTKKKARYTIKLEHVPVFRSQENMAIILGLKSNFEVNPGHSIWNIKYNREFDSEGSDIFTFYPQDIAAYISVAASYWRQHNLTPMDMNPFALPSRLEAEFYRKLCNNIIVFDPSLTSRNKLRKLHLDEKCILLGRSIKVLGHDESMFWDPARDGKLRDYEWGVPKSKSYSSV